MPLVHHIVEQWGCNYTNDDDKGLNERTPRTFNVETQIQANVDGMGVKEGIGLR
jgi:hypothetical protein